MCDFRRELRSEKESLQDAFGKIVDFVIARETKRWGNWGSLLSTRPRVRPQVEEAREATSTRKGILAAQHFSGATTTGWAATPGTVTAEPPITYMVFEIAFN